MSPVQQTRCVTLCVHEHKHFQIYLLYTDSEVFLTRLI